MKTRQLGFAHLLVLLVVVIAAIGSGGWYVLHKSSTHKVSTDKPSRMTFTVNLLPPVGGRCGYYSSYKDYCISQDDVNKVMNFLKCTTASLDSLSTSAKATVDADVTASTIRGRADSSIKAEIIDIHYLNINNLFSATANEKCH